MRIQPAADFGWASCVTLCRDCLAGEPSPPWGTVRLTRNARSIQRISWPGSDPWVYRLDVASLITPEHVLEAAEIVADSLAVHVAQDWSGRAGPLEWDVERTVTHMVAAPAKYTLYLAARSEKFIALTISKWPDATHHELVASIRPIARGLAAVAKWVPADTRAFHADGPTDVNGFLAMACVELLVHADDALQGLGSRLDPPEDLAS